MFTPGLGRRRKTAMLIKSGSMRCWKRLYGRSRNATLRCSVLAQLGSASLFGILAVCVAVSWGRKRNMSWTQPSPTRPLGIALVVFDKRKAIFSSMSQLAANWNCNFGLHIQICFIAPPSSWQQTVLSWVFLTICISISTWHKEKKYI